MKIFVADFIFSPGHRTINTTLVAALSQFAGLTVVDNGRNYFRDRLTSDIRWLDIRDRSAKAKGSLSGRLVYKKYASQQHRLFEKEGFDAVFVQAFDVIAFTLSKFAKCKVPVYLIHHHNLDELSNKVKLWFFKKYMNKVNHIVFEEYFKDYLVNEIGVEEQRVFLLHHPMRPLSKSSSIEDEKLFVGVSNSNDEAMVCDIIDYELKNKILESNGIKLVLRSKTRNVESSFLTANDRFYDKDEYDDLIGKATRLILPFPATYRFRCSGNLFDAISYNKGVLASQTKFFENYSQRYPDTCQIFHSVDELFSLMTAPIKDEGANERQIIIENGNMENTAKTLKEILRVK